MNRNLLVPFALGLIMTSGLEDAFGQTLLWAKKAGGLSIDSGNGVGRDSAGNNYVTGTIGASATFGAGDATQTTLTTTNASRDMFLAKYDSNGVLVWARVAGGDFNDDAWGVAVDSAGNSHITGSLGQFTTLANFGGGVTLASQGGYVAKYDNGGNAVWATSLNVSGIGFGIAVDTAGNTYVTGLAPDPILGGGIVTTWKLNASGTIQWTKQATGVYSGAGSGARWIVLGTAM